MQDLRGGTLKAWLGYFYLSLAAAIWGGMYVVSRVVLNVIPAYVLLEYRFLLAFVVLGLVAALSQSLSIQMRHFALFALIGIVGYTLSIGLQFVGTHLSGAALGSLLTSASPALIALFAALWLRERLTWSTISGVVLASLGVGAVIGLPSAHSGTVTGNLALLGAAVSWAAYTVLSRVATKVYSSLTVAFYATFFGVLFTAPVAFWQASSLHYHNPNSLSIWIGVLYLGVISTALAFFLWNKGFESVPASRGSLFFFVQPVVGSALGAILLKESLTWSFFAGAALISAGVYLSLRSPAQAAPDLTRPANEVESGRA